MHYYPTMPFLALVALLIDWIVFYAVSAIVQPYYGGAHWLEVTSFEILKFPCRSSRAYFCVPRGCNP